MDSKEVGAIVRAAREKKGWSQMDLARAIGIKQSSVQSIEKGDTQRSKYLPEIARELDIPPDHVGLPKEIPAPPLPGQPQSIIPASSLLVPNDLIKVYASAEGGPGQIILSTDPMEFIPRPTAVAGVRDAYGLYITGDSMFPEFEPGDLAIINPALPPLPNTTCIFYTERDGAARATIKRLRKASPNAWQVRQWNPPSGQNQDFSLDRREWTVCHRVATKNYGR